MPHKLDLGWQSQVLRPPGFFLPRRSDHGHRSEGTDFTSAAKDDANRGFELLDVGANGDFKAGSLLVRWDESPFTHRQPLCRLRPGRDGSAVTRYEWQLVSRCELPQSPLCRGADDAARSRLRLSTAGGSTRGRHRCRLRPLRPSWQSVSKAWHPTGRPPRLRICHGQPASLSSPGSRFEGGLP